MSSMEDSTCDHSAETVVIISLLLLLLRLFLRRDFSCIGEYFTTTIERWQDSDFFMAS